MPTIPEVPLHLTLRPGAPSVRIHARSRLMRAHLLLLLGLGSACGDGKLFGNGYDCGDYEPGRRDYTATLTLEDKAEACPEDPDYDSLAFSSSYYYYSSDCETPTLESQEKLLCTYSVNCETWSCCGYGRPYLDEDGNTVSAESTESVEWSEESAVDVRDLSPGDQAKLKAFWLKNAAAEHSSVAGFHRFALDLLAHGAPPELVRRAGQAAAQEITHAIDCFTLASTYAGTRLGPKPLKIGTSAPIAQTLAELAAWTVRDGVVGETIAAYLAAEALESATDPEVRRVLEKVVADETAHAELAWETLLWALQVGDDTVLRAVRSVFDSIQYPQTPAHISTAGTVAHGLLSAQQQDAAARRCIDEVLRPVMASLLSRSLAA